MHTLLSSLDTLATALESRGLTKLAAAVDTVSNTVAAGPLMPGSGQATAEVVKSLTADRAKMSVSAKDAAAALKTDPHLLAQCRHLADLMRLSPSGPWTTDVKTLVEALNDATSHDSSLRALVESLKTEVPVHAKTAGDEVSLEMLAIAMVLTAVNQPT